MTMPCVPPIRTAPVRGSMLAVNQNPLGLWSRTMAMSGSSTANRSTMCEPLSAMSLRASGLGTPLNFGLSAFVIARENEAEAQAALSRLSELAKLDAPIRAVQRANTDPSSVMAQTMSKTPRVGSNGGTAAGLVGSYDQVAERIRQFGDAGIELFMLQFQPFEAEMRRFAAEIMPRVRRL